ncbi:MAG: hypothetical protein AB1489_01890 [Acidobacteriota bacterium]
MAKPGTIGPPNPKAQPSPSWLRRAEKIWNWEAVLLAKMGGAVGGGGGLFFFDFSGGGRITEPFMFIAGGAGLGESIGGTGLPDFRTKKLHYSTLNVRKAFSVNDLDGAGGFIIGGSVSLVAGYKVISICAFDKSGMLFDLSDCSGPAAGVGVDVFAFAGLWRSTSNAAAALNQKRKSGR